MVSMAISLHNAYDEVAQVLKAVVAPQWEQ